MDPKPELRYTQVRPTRAVGASPTGSIDFEFISRPDELIDWQSAYLSAVVDLTKRNADNTANVDWLFNLGTAAAAANRSDPTKLDSVSQNCFATVFKSATLYVNDVAISQNQQFSQASTQFKLAMNNTDEEVDALSPIIPYKYNSLDTYNDDNEVSNAKSLYLGATGTLMHTPATPATDGIRFATPQDASRLDRWGRIEPVRQMNLTVSGGGGAAAKLHLALPLAPLFQQHTSMEPLPHCKVRLDLNFEPNYPTKFPIVARTQTVNFNFSKLFLQIPTYKNPLGIPPSVYTTRYMETTTHQKAYSESVQTHISNGAVRTVLLSFGQLVVNPVTSVEVDSNQYGQVFKGGNGLQTLYVQYAGKSYPSPQYDFVGGVDYVRAYMDYRVYSMAHSSAVGNVMKFEDWMESPLFIFHVEPEIGSFATHITIESKGSANLSKDTHEMFISMLYEKELTIEYNESAQPTRTVENSIN